MPMPMVFVRRVMMSMLKRRVTMRMGVRLTSGIQRSVLVPMVRVMRVRMLMRQAIVNMDMFVMLGDVKPDTHGHQRRGDEELGGQRLAEHEHGGCGAAEPCGREIGAGARP